MYATVTDLRDEGITEAQASDDRLTALIEEASASIDRITPFVIRGFDINEGSPVGATRPVDEVIVDIERV